VRHNLVSYHDGLAADGEEPLVSLYVHAPAEHKLGLQPKPNNVYLWTLDHFDGCYDLPDFGAPDFVEGYKAARRFFDAKGYEPPTPVPLPPPPPPKPKPPPPESQVPPVSFDFLLDSDDSDYEAEDTHKRKREDIQNVSYDSDSA